MASSLDKLTIETPEQLPLEFPLAGIGSRFLALAFDTLIQVVVGLGVFVVFLVILSVNFLFWGGGGPWAVAILILVVFLLQFGYFAIFESIWNGQTPGKRYMKLRVIKDSGRPITPYDAIARNLMRIVDSLPGIYGVGILSALLSAQNKRLGDYVAGTVVVHEKPLEDVQPVWTEAAQADGLLYDVEKLTPQELQLIETFLQRRSHLDAEVRRQTAWQISERMAQKLAVPQEGRPAPEAFLEAIAQQSRRAARYR